MANPEHVAKLKEGVKAWNEWRKTTGEVEVDLVGVELDGLSLRHADLTRANLSFAKLTATDLSGAVLSWANVCHASLQGTNFYRGLLADADFSNAALSYANLEQAYVGRVKFNKSLLEGARFVLTNLSGADLTKADLRKADLSGADLSDADFTEARLGWTTFANTTFYQTKGLDTCFHSGPSSVGIDTFFQSNNSIPEAFLRGCGVPEQFITNARSLVADAIQFYSCFISYSAQDQEFARRLHADLQARNLRCWFAPEDLKIGDRFQERIEESIRLFDKVMIVLSKSSVESRWVEREVNTAREREDRENRTVLFPLRIDDAVMEASQPWAADIRRSRHIGDFSRWKDHDSYRRGLERLLRDLEAKGSAAVQGA